jgi:LysR family transcriptional regulator, glycine cleavage system transcriptional activator
MKAPSSRPAALKSLQAFCVAAELQSFKSAAEQLHLTPSAVSHQMKELERTLGVRLFERRTRGVGLTGAGRALYQDITPLLAAIEASVKRISQRQRRITLRLLLPPFLASELFIPTMATFCAGHPDIDIHVDSHEARPILHPAGADISVLLGVSPPDGLYCAPLFPLSLVAACARQHAATVQRLGARVFGELPLIVHKTLPYAWRSWAEQLRLEAPEAKNVLELDTMFAVVRAAERGVGIALVPETPAAAWFDAGTLVRAFPAPLVTADSYYVVARQDDAARAEVAAMIHWIRTSLLNAAVAGEQQRTAYNMSLAHAS